MSGRSPFAAAGSSTPSLAPRRCPNAILRPTAAGSAARSSMPSTSPTAKRPCGPSGIATWQSVRFHRSRRCRVTSGRGRSTSRSPTSRRRSASPPSAYPLLAQVTSPGPPSSASESASGKTDGRGCWLRARRDRRAESCACSATPRECQAQRRQRNPSGFQSHPHHRLDCELDVTDSDQDGVVFVASWAVTSRRPTSRDGRPRSSP